jgi:prepilin-type N-terminal cleavage/methylation domain-containing protein/prepilin-type processing-associated H-X9-DG protein
MTSARKARVPGFTLVELLVVISIIVILGALLFPVAQGVLQRARAAACVSNLRQISALFPLYAMDNDGYVPLSIDGAVQPWYRYLYPYIQVTNMAASQSIFRCPGKGKSSDPTDISGHCYGIEQSATYTGAHVRIKLNSIMYGNGGIPLDKGRRWLVIDSSWYLIIPGASSGGTAVATKFRHANRANVLMPDLSVQSMTKQDVNEQLYLYKQNPIP